MPKRLRRRTLSVTLTIFLSKKFVKRTRYLDTSTILVDMPLHFQPGILVEVSTITIMYMEFQFSVKDTTKLDISGAQRDFLRKSEQMIQSQLYKYHNADDVDCCPS